MKHEPHWSLEDAPMANMENAVWLVHNYCDGDPTCSKGYIYMTKEGEVKIKCFGCHEPVDKNILTLAIMLNARTLIDPRVIVNRELALDEYYNMMTYSPNPTIPSSTWLKDILELLENELVY